MMSEKQELECCETTHTHEDIIGFVRKQLTDEELLRELADLFKIFGDTTRVRILNALLISEMCVCDLAEVLEMSQSAISHQLRVLKQAKLVKNRREGKTVFYSLADGHIQTIINQGMEHVIE